MANPHNIKEGQELFKIDENGEIAETVKVGKVNREYAVVSDCSEHYPLRLRLSDLRVVNKRGLWRASLYVSRESYQREVDAKKEQAETSKAWEALRRSFGWNVPHGMTLARVKAAQAILFPEAHDGR